MIGPPWKGTVARAICARTDAPAPETQLRARQGRVSAPAGAFSARRVLVGVRVDVDLGLCPS